MSTAAQWFEQGQEALGLSRSADSRSDYEADLRRALNAFEQALAADPSHLPALREKAQTHAALGDHEAAADAFIAAAQLAPLDLALHFAAARSLRQLGLREAALGHLDRALTLAPADPESLFLRAQLLTALGRDEEALAAWGAVLDHPLDGQATLSGGQRVRVVFGDSRPLEALFTRALLRSRRGEEGARAAYVALFEAHGVALTGLGAPPAVSEALQADPTCREAYLQYLGATAEVNAWRRAFRLFIEARRHDEALTVAQRLVELAPTDREAWWNRGEAHAARGALQEAIADLERSLALDPGYLAAQARLKALRAQAAAARLVEPG